jgi:hypothetical protein
MDFANNYLSMKNLKIVVFLLGLFVLGLTINVCAQVNLSTIPSLPTDSFKGCVRCLKMNGKMDLAKNNRAVAIHIYSEDSLVYTMQSSNKSGLFNFFLPFNHSFKVVLSKPGYYDKFFMVNTTFTRKSMLSQYEIEFSTDMFKTMDEMNVDVLKKPLVEIEFNKIRNEFVFDPIYTQSINDEMAKLYANYAIQQKLEADSPGPQAFPGK